MSLPQPLPLIPAAEDIVPAMRRIVDDHNAARLQILETVNPDIATFENVMGPLAQVENSVQGAFAMIDMLQYGSPSLATHEAFDNAREIYAEAEAAWKSDKSFFELLQAAREKDNFHKLDGESRHLMERELLKYKRAGHGLIGDTLLQEYQKRYSEILELELEFQQNVARENGGLWFTLNELEGIPKSELEKWKDERDGEDKVNSSRKKKFVPFTNGGTLAVLTYAHRPETRKRMFLADNLKLERNKPLFEKIVANRAKQAHLLNYSSHAAFRVEERMIKTTTRLKEFLSHVQNTLCPRGKAEIEVLQRRRFEDLRARGHDGAEQLEQGFPPWEKRYYERLVEQGFKIDQLKIAEFFPLEQTTASMLNVFASLFGLRFDPVTDDLLTEDVIWHDSVRAFSVWDSRDSEFIGYLYFDLLWREYKFRGNHDVNIQCGYLRPDGTRQYPVNILMCSFPTPTPETCVLLKHHQIVTLFHEMGHGIHDLLARTKYVRFHGYNTTLDFREMPSSMLENWCWMKKVLKDLSCHYTMLNDKYLIDWRKQHPGEPDPPKEIPDHLVDNLIKHRYFNRGLYHLRQLSISMFDLEVHSLSTDSEIANLDVQKLFYDLREEIEGMDFTECKNGFEFGTFNHLVSDYDVCYYGYLWCTAIAQDIIQTLFADNPYDKGAWEKYRREILEYGGSHPDEVAMLTNFLGRPPKMNALMESLALEF